MLERAKENEAARAHRVAHLDAERAARREEHERERQESHKVLEQRLVRQYQDAGATEQEARQALPTLVERHRLAEMDREVAELAHAQQKMRF